MNIYIYIYIYITYKHQATSTHNHTIKNTKKARPGDTKIVLSEPKGAPLVSSGVAQERKEAAGDHKGYPPTPTFEHSLDSSTSTS